MTKSLQEIRAQMKRLVEDTSDEVSREPFNKIQQKAFNEIEHIFNKEPKKLLDGELESEKIREWGKLLLPNKPNGPFTFIFDCLDWFPNPIDTEEYTSKATDFAEACKEALKYKKEQLDGILHLRSDLVEIQ